MKELVSNGLIIFDKALPFYGKKVYGAYIKVEEEILHNQKSIPNQSISTYCTYLLALSQLLKSGGDTSDDGMIWTYDKQKLFVNINHGMKLFLNVILDGMIKYKVVRIDPIDVTEDCLVTDYKIIEQNRNNEPIEIGGDK